MANKNTSNKHMTAKQRQEQAAKQQKKEMIIIFSVAAVIILAIILVFLFTGNGSNVTSTSGDSSHVHDENCDHSAAAPTQSEELKKVGDGATLETAKETHIATIEIEGYGTIKAELYGNTAPTSVENFVALAESGFYDGLTFHRIMESFMMQGGAGNDSSRDVEAIPGEFSANGFENNLLHKKGVLSMARADDMNSATSQFFIMHEDSPHLDGDYAAFGMVIEGQDIVDKICTEAEPTDNNGTIPKDQQPVIKSITVEEAK